MLIICLPIRYQWKDMEDHLCLFLSSFVSTACVQSLKVRILTFWSHLSRPRPSAKYITSTLESASPLLIPSSIFNQSGVVPCWQVIIVVPLKIFLKTAKSLSIISRRTWSSFTSISLSNLLKPSRSIVYAQSTGGHEDLPDLVFLLFKWCYLFLYLWNFAVVSVIFLYIFPVAWYFRHDDNIIIFIYLWIRRIVCIYPCFLTEFHELSLSIPSVCFGSWVAWFSYSCAE